MKIKNNIKRVLFDFDGTLFDTQILHAQAEAALMKEHGVIVSAEEISRKYAGRPTEDVFKEILGCEHKLALQLMKRKWEIIFPSGPETKMLCDISNILYELRIRDIAFSIGTASPIKWAHDVLTAHGLMSEFDTNSIIGGDMVKHGKPKPDIWIAAARETPLEECVVIEDGIAGIEAALSVNIPCALLLPKTYPGARPIHHTAELLNFI